MPPALFRFPRPSKKQVQGFLFGVATACAAFTGWLIWFLSGE